MNKRKYEAPLMSLCALEVDNAVVANGSSVFEGEVDFGEL